MRGRLTITALLAVLLTLLAADAATATFPGANGKIVYAREAFSGGSLRACTIDPDGTDKNCAPATFESTFATPAWSPDGEKILYAGFDGDLPAWQGLYTVDPGLTTKTFVRENGFQPEWSPTALAKLVFVTQPLLATSNVDGSGLEQLPPTDDNGVWMPDWSPDGKTVVFQTNPSNQWDLFLLTYATGEMRLLTWEHGTSKYWPDFSPDGSKILYTTGSPEGSAANRLWSVNVDGSGLTNLGEGHRGRWSPDGTKIVFTDGARDIYIADADGSDRTLLDTRFDDLEGRPTKSFWPDWQPLPVDTPSTHVRPKSANRVQFSLVPAYRECNWPNREHGPPLAFSSCAPPEPGSSHLTAGVGDGHPAPARSTGVVRLRVTPGIPGGADDTTARVRLSITNVMRAADLSDYTGELRGSIRVRVTDREDVVAQTVQDLPLEWSVPCTPTDSTTEGSTCQLGTDLDAILPGATPEGMRAIWAVDQVKVYDGGPDEDADTEGDNEPFAVQGVFVP